MQPKTKNNKNKNNCSILRISNRWRILFLRKFCQCLNCVRDLLYLIESGRLFQILQPRTLFLNFFSMCLGNIQYPLPKLCSVHSVNLNRLAKQSGARSFKVLYMKINTKVDRKPVRFFFSATQWTWTQSCRQSEIWTVGHWGSLHHRTTICRMKYDTLKDL